MKLNRRQFLGSAGGGLGVLGIPQTTIKTGNPELQDFAEDVEFDFEAKKIIFPDYFEPDYEASLGVPNPEEYIETNVGDCDDYATMIASVAEIQGYNTKLSAGILDYVYKGERVTTSHMNARMQERQRYICDINRFETLMTSFELENQNSSEVEFYPIYIFERGDLASAEIDSVLRLLDENADEIINYVL